MERYAVLIMPAGWRFDADADTPLLRAAEQAGIALPSSCRNGSCRTCICRLAEGEARHLVEWPGLSREEKDEGYILPCCAVALGPLTLEAPLARRAEPA